MNPFRDSIVASPWKSQQVDVPEIHAGVFEECVNGIAAVRAAGASKGLLIHGEAGSGKTHLLSRLRSRLVPELPIATDREETLFIWVRLQTTPRMIWRHLRRTLVDDWFRPVEPDEEGHTQFQRILFHRLAEYRPAEWDLEPWYEYMLDEDPEGLVQCVDKIADKLDLDRNTTVAFEHIAFQRHLRNLRAWLAGDSLPEAALERMGFTQDEGTDEEREDEARRVVVMLCKLAGNDLPIVMGFDQVEALQLRPGDQDALFAFGQLVSTLHDAATNLLLVSCVQSGFADEIVDHVRGADYDRLTDLGKFSLDPLNGDQANQLIGARLPVTENHPHPPWPLSQSDLEKLTSKGDLTPRKLLNFCAERFDNPDDSSQTVDEGSTVEDFLSDEWETRLEEQSNTNLLGQTEEIVRHGFPKLAQIVAPEFQEVREPDLRDIQLVFAGSQGKTGVSVCAQSNMTSLGAGLKRLKTEFAQDTVGRLVIIRPSGQGISEGAKKTKQTLSELQERGAVVLHPSDKAMEALDALRKLLSDAASGDLACRGEKVAATTVEEWLRANLPGELQELADDILGQSVSGRSDRDGEDAQRIEALNELLGRKPVIPLEEAAETLRQPLETLAATARRHPGHFRLLGEPPSLMFQAVEGARD